MKLLPTKLMPMKPFLPFSIFVSMVIGSTFAMSACTQTTVDIKADDTPMVMERGGEIPSIKSAISCLPDQTALIAAHRGVSENWDMPENSASGLQRLIDEGYLVAEIDVASTKDGTLFLFHDGIWDETSTGKGPISASTDQDLDKILLKSRRGSLASERPLRFTDALDIAENKIYLEIDFKSSASPAEVIDIIQEKDMGDQVVLIAYTSEQAVELQRLAPDMVLSAPGQDKGRGLSPENTLLWMGRDIATVNDKTNTLGYIGMVGRPADTASPGPRRQGKLLVTDFPDEFPPVWGLTSENKAAYQACLTEA